MEAFTATRTQRVCLDSDGLDAHCPFSILERIRYSPEVPYSIVRQAGQNGVGLPHYSDTLEVVVNFGVRGEFSICGKAIPLQPESILFIPPGQLHGSRMYAGKEDYLLNLKFSFGQLRCYADIERMYAAKSHTIADLAFSRPDRGESVTAINRLICEDGSLFGRTAAVIRLFGVWEQGIPASCSRAVLSSRNDLNDLVSWTEKNFREHITIDDAAGVMHLSRSYFCKYFRKQTGMTYLSYLNQLRVEHAALLLLSGQSASACCTECGFEDLPYFIQLFKKLTGYSTREYVRRQTRRDGI